jgi:hypothetical protein
LAGEVAEGGARQRDTVEYKRADEEALMLRGGLFTREYLLEGIKESDAWKSLDDSKVCDIRVEVEKRLSSIQKIRKPSEAETETELIWPVLRAIGWNNSLPQQNLSFGGREKVPDGLLFGDSDAKDKAAAEKGASRFRHGLCIMEAKRWGRPLDRGDKTDPADAGIPSNQMLNYLRRVDDVTRGKLRWGILTNGRYWRLYFQGADSVSEEFLEIDLSGVFQLPGYQAALEDVGCPPDHALRLFVLLFGRDAFLSVHRGQTLHALVRDQGKHWEAGVATNLSQIVFNELYPGLVKAIAAHDPTRDAGLSAEYLSEVRQGALIFLYRLLFVLYAEDRHLLPVERDAYKEFALTRLREDIAAKKAGGSDFSDRSTLYWSRLETIFRAIGEGDDTLGIPPYNGGLFEQAEAPILARCKLPDKVLADIIFPLSHEQAEPRPKYINYRDLSVQQLGSIYESLLEFDVVAEDKAIAIRLNPFARKRSGSYYTPEPLVKLIIERAVGPLVAERLDQFRVKAEELSKSRRPIKERLDELAELDPASRILELKVCDPAMGSGHFLVSLVDWMADRVLAAIDHASELIDWAEGTPYESPLIKRIATIRSRIEKRAKEHKWPLPERQLDERNIVRRMILKRCVYGVDLNPMAVELAKVSLWLHTFTVGAPLSFLDHHLRCGNSLFGEHVRGAIDWLAKRGTLLINDIIQKAKAVSAGMEKVEALTDADIAEVKESETNFEDVEFGIRPIVALLDFIQLLRWQDPKDNTIKTLVSRFLDGQYGDPLLVLGGRPSSDADFTEFYEQCRRQLAEHRFLHWEVAFPGVWSNWESVEPHGGFDAVIGNPPWERVKFQEVEWFAAHKPEIAHIDTKAKRQKKIAELRKSGDALVAEYELAADRAEAMSRVARSSGEYPYLSGGDTNLNSLFVERAHRLLKTNGLVGLLVPSGIASDQSSSAFFKKMCETQRLDCVIDFFNKKDTGDLFFPDVYYRFKFCAYVAGGTKRKFGDPHFAFFVRDLAELDDPERFFTISPSLMKSLDPENSTAPVFQQRRDMAVTEAIYKNVPMLSRLIGGVSKEREWVWPIKYSSMLHMANDSGVFHTAAALEKAGAYPVDGNFWKKGSQAYVPLFEGKMVQAYDHRASDIVSVAQNVFRTGQGNDLNPDDHADPKRLPAPRYFVATSDFEWLCPTEWCIALKDITSVTNSRSLIAAAIPRVAVGHTLPLLVPQIPSSKARVESKDFGYSTFSPLVLGNLNAVILDYLARQKINSNHVAWFMLQQLPFAPPNAYARKFGKKSAAEIVTNDVLALTYTANDMEPFARDMGYTGKPFKWDEADRARRRARLDALYFMLYFPSGTKAEIESLRETAHYIFSTFPIVEREDMDAHGRYLSRDLCLAYINALAAGDADATIKL